MTADAALTSGFRSWKIVRLLERDRLLTIATAILSAAVLLPLTQTSILPLNDLPNHIAMTSMMRHLLHGDPVAKEHFELLLIPAPYWTTYLLMLLASYVMPVLVAAKLVVAIALLSVPFGTMRLLSALGRSPRLGLWAFALSWEWSLTMGFISYTVTLGIAFFYVARCIDTMKLEKIPTRDLVITGLLALWLGQSHAHVTGFASVLVFALALAELPNLRRAGRMFGLAALPTLGLVPWVLLGKGAGRGGIPHNIGGWPDAAERVVHMFPNALDLVTGTVGRNVFGFAFLFFLIVPLLMSVAARGEPSHSDRRALALYVAAWTLYLVMPSWVVWPVDQILIYERHATPILVLGLVLVPGAFVGRAGWRLVPGVALALALCAVITVQCREFSKWVDPFQAVIDAVKPGSKVAWVVWESHTPESVRETLPQVPAYILAEKGGYGPYLFENANIPFRYRDNTHLPHPDWHHPDEFTLADYGVFYDYVLVQGKDRDRLSEGVVETVDGSFRARKVIESGIWRLYAISREPGPVREDLARSKPWRASSSLMVCDPAHTTCGGVHTAIFFHTEEEESPWVEVDLGEPTPFTHVTVVNRRDGPQDIRDRAVPLLLEVSDDEATWKPLGRTDTSFGSWSPGFAPTTARYVRARSPRKTYLHLEGLKVYR